MTSQSHQSRRWHTPTGRPRPPPSTNKMLLGIASLMNLLIVKGVRRGLTKREREREIEREIWRDRNRESEKGRSEIDKERERERKRERNTNEQKICCLIKRLN